MHHDNEQYEFKLQGGNYKIYEKVGAGGMGIIYRGVDNLMREVAIKEFSPAQSEGFSVGLLSELRDAFYREARLLANLEHPSLPKVYGYFEENEKLYLVMEFIQGDNLKKQVEELKSKFDGQFSISKVKQWTKELLGVLVYLHDRDSPIFHRDIKPDNLKIRDGRICLLDFGLAKGSAGNMSVEATRTIYGFTLKFAPIEQIRGDRTTAQTDLYALAATIYYLLTGQEPADARKRERAIKENKPDPLPDVRSLRSEVDPVYGEVIMQALAVEAHRRPGTAKAMLNKLETYAQKPEAIDDDEKTIPHQPPFVPEPLARPPIVSPAPAAVPHSRVSRKLILAGVAVVGVVLTFVTLFFFFVVTPATEPGPVVTSRKLKVDRELYDTPYGGKIIDIVRRGTEIEIEEERAQNTNGGLTWYQIRIPNSREEGWFNCARREEPCF